jgi:Uri superfamily endonuclease
MRPDKPHRWHADYLFARHPARQAWLIDGYGGSSECALAAALASAASAARVGSLPPGRPTRAPSSLRPRAFGASDCGCPGHLVVFRHREHLRGAVQEAIGAVNGNLVRE